MKSNCMTPDEVREMIFTDPKFKTFLELAYECMELAAKKIAKEQEDAA